MPRIPSCHRSVGCVEAVACGAVGPRIRPWPGHLYLQHVRGSLAADAVFGLLHFGAAGQSCRGRRYPRRVPSESLPRPSHRRRGHHAPGRAVARSQLTRVVSTIGLAVVFCLWLSALIVSAFWPIWNWDALAMFDYRGRVIAATQGLDFLKTRVLGLVSPAYVARPCLRLHPRRERTPDNLSAVLPRLASRLLRKCPKYFRPRGRRRLHAPAGDYAAPLDARHGSVHESDVHLLLPWRRSLRL